MKLGSRVGSRDLAENALLVGGRWWYMAVSVVATSTVIAAATAVSDTEMLSDTAYAPDNGHGHGMSANGSERASAGRVGMVGLIVAEASLFAVFVVAYLYDLGRSLSGPSPREVLSVPVLGTVCLLSSSVTVALAVRALARGAVGRAGAWLLATVLLAGTAAEWLRLMTRDGLTIGTNLFGTTFYALVGLHASHVIVGLVMLALIARSPGCGRSGLPTSSAWSSCPGTGTSWTRSGSSCAPSST